MSHNLGLLEQNVCLLARRCQVNRVDSQVHEEEGAHHQKESTQVGVEVHNHE